MPTYKGSKYVLLEASTSEELSGIVASYVWDDWKLYGQPVVSRSLFLGNMFLQAMTKD